MNDKNGSRAVQRLKVILYLMQKIVIIFLAGQLECNHVSEKRSDHPIFVVSKVTQML